MYCQGREAEVTFKPEINKREESGKQVGVDRFLEFQERKREKMEIRK